MKVSAYFELGMQQPFLDFVDVDLDTDIPVFVDPSALRTMKSEWATECVSMLQHFFEAVLLALKTSDKNTARYLLSYLNERNEFHLGLSKGESRGHAIGSKYAELMLKALGKTKAARTLLLTDLEDTALLIPGIGPDLISDAICNIIRGPLINYTQEMSKYYGIPLTPGVASGPIWNVHTGRWEECLIQLPMTKHGPVVLVPKLIVRHRLSIDAGSYYRHYLLPAMQRDEINANTSIVRTLKSGKNKGEKRVSKKALIEKYGADKLAIAKQSEKRQAILKEYKKDARRRTRPLDHHDFVDLGNNQDVDWRALIKQLRQTNTGTAYASAYHSLTERILSALLYPHLVHPEKEQKIHGGRKRVDIRYTNESKSGFFSWVSQHYVAPFIWVECKNYKDDVGNPELDQLSGRFSTRRGEVGLLLHRKIDNKSLLYQRCKDTATDGRGYIVPIDDDDLIQMIQERIDEGANCRFSLLRKLFNQLVE